MKEIISIKNLEYTYPDGTKALKGVNLNIYEGESVGLIGPNGAGKSTLTLHLNGILRGNGKVEIMGLDIREESLNIIRKKVGLVFQNPEDQLFMPTVFDDVAFGPINIGFDKEKIKVLVKEALEKVDMADSTDRISHHLSFGEKKRVAIATVLSMQPEILVLDEPTSELDPRAKRDLLSLINDLNITKIISGHDLDFIKNTCSRIIFLKEGKLIKDTQVEILDDKEFLESNGL